MRIIFKKLMIMMMMMMMRLQKMLMVMLKLKKTIITSTVKEIIILTNLDIV